MNGKWMEIDVKVKNIDFNKSYKNDFVKVKVKKFIIRNINIL